jgi:hypothetical protein
MAGYILFMKETSTGEWMKLTQSERDDWKKRAAKKEQMQQLDEVRRQLALFDKKSGPRNTDVYPGREMDSRYWALNCMIGRRRVSDGRNLLVDRAIKEGNDIAKSGGYVIFLHNQLPRWYACVRGWPSELRIKVVGWNSHDALQVREEKFKEVFRERGLGTVNQTRCWEGDDTENEKVRRMVWEAEIS